MPSTLPPIGVAKTTPQASATGMSFQQMVPWLIVLAGLAFAFAPTYMDLFRTVWANDEQMHGPIILGVSAWLLYRKWPVLSSLKPEPAVFSGFLLLIFGVLCYTIGRTQAIIQLEAGAQIVLIAAVVLLLVGRAGLKAVWFPLFFLLFMIPLPGVFVQALTIPLKMGVSYVAEHLLFWAGYPVARTGVILQVGQYHLLVADACAGLHTMFTLEALGLFYMNIMGHTSLWRNSLLAALIIPISIIANIIRVMVLVLVTYHLGDEAGQGFLHGFAGMVLFMTALILIMGVDTILGRFFRRPHVAA